MGGILLVALAVGIVTGVSPGLGIAVAAALVFALIVMWDLALGVCLFLLVTFLDVVSSNQNLSLTKAAGAVLAASWLATVATRSGSRRGLTSHAPWLVAAVTAFVAWSAVSVFWAESKTVAITSTFRFALDALLIPIVFWAVRERKHVVWIFSVFIVGSLLSVLYGLTHGKATGGVSAAQVGRLSGAAAQVGRLTGANVEANELATLLVVCTVFAIALFVVLRRKPVARKLTLLAAVVALAAFFATFSREGIIALAVVILAGCVYAGKARPAFVALVLGVVLIGAVFLESTSSGAVSRLSLSSNSSGRTDIWKVGLQMVRANPVVGVGSGNYTVAEPRYFLSVPGTIQHGSTIIGKPYVAHNMYLQLLAEMGVVGLALFLSVVVLSICTAVLAVKLFRARGDRSSEILGRALIIAILGILVADFFASFEYSKQLWLLLGLGPALLALARRSPVSRGPAPPRQMSSGPLAPPDPVRQR